MDEDMIPDGSAVVTPNQMLDRIDNLANEVHRLSTLMDPALTQVRGEVSENRANIAVVDQKVNSNSEALNAKVAQTNERVGAMNAKIWAMAVAATAAGATAGQLVSQILGGS